MLRMFSRNAICSWWKNIGCYICYVTSADTRLLETEDNQGIDGPHHKAKNKAKEGS